VPGKKKGQPSTAQERRLAFAEVAKARVEIEFNRKDDETGETDADEDQDGAEVIDEDEEG